ncbi:hypothetical protein [Paraburkholderia sp. HD33-4]|uniref:hypothetical protein n=1 Tax=Paraburkholderia sp. HD33-4 TaxID=2883242 RepID=UPI001F36719E|nr:hypothetical protein [Paraburkholderia sp. HD33-4]
MICLDTPAIAQDASRAIGSWRVAVAAAASAAESFDRRPVTAERDAIALTREYSPYC